MGVEHSSLRFLSRAQSSECPAHRRHSAAIFVNFVKKPLRTCAKGLFYKIYKDSLSAGYAVRFDKLDIDFSPMIVVNVYDSNDNEVTIVSRSTMVAALEEAISSIF